jgi:hypothetical protein
MNGAPPLEYHFVYTQGEIVSFTIRHIQPNDLQRLRLLQDRQQGPYRPHH